MIDTINREIYDRVLEALGDIAAENRRLTQELAKALKENREKAAETLGHRILTNTGGLTIRRLFEVSLRRSSRWHGKARRWTVLEWAGAMCGEAGEAANIAKKIQRVRDNISRGDEDIADLKSKLVAELCDILLYMPMLIDSIWTKEVEVRFEKILIDTFNKKSEEYGYPERL